MANLGWINPLRMSVDLIRNQFHQFDPPVSFRSFSAHVKKNKKTIKLLNYWKYNPCPHERNDQVHGFKLNSIRFVQFVYDFFFLSLVVTWTVPWEANGTAHYVLILQTKEGEIASNSNRNHGTIIIPSFHFYWWSVESRKKGTFVE